MSEKKFLQIRAENAIYVAQKRIYRLIMLFLYMREQKRRFHITSLIHMTILCRYVASAIQRKAQYKEQYGRTAKTGNRLFWMVG